MFKPLFASVAILFLVSCQSISDNTIGALQEMVTGELTESSIGSGLKQALDKGVVKATKDLSNGGYSRNAIYRITVPEDLQKFTSTLKKIGFKSEVQDFENKMNEAAEQAVLKATPIFLDAISDMTLQDVNSILMGKETAATDFFKKATTSKLRKEYLPIVKSKMSEIGLVGEFNNMIDKYNSIPFTDKLSFSLESYITDEALKGLFDQLAETERDIRKNPAARTTELLKRVFAKQDK